MLPHDSYTDIDPVPNAPSDGKDRFGQVKLEDINHYIEHPVPIRPPGESEEKPPIAMFLTEKERKRLRKQTRAEREKEKQERVLMGLEEAPAPKVKLSNLSRVLGESIVITSHCITSHHHITLHHNIITSTLEMMK